MKTLHTIYSTFAKRNLASLRLLLVMLLTLTVSAEVWADFTPGTGYTLVTDISSLSTNDKVILFCNQNGEGVSGYNGNKDATVSTTAANWIEYLVTKSTNSFTLKDGNEYIAKPGGNEFKYGDSGGACTLGSDGLLICNSRNLMRNGTNYRFYATTQSYTNRFYVYKVAVSYAITAQSNNTTYGTVSLRGTTITASPKTGYRVSTTTPYEVTEGTATVTNNGDNTFSVSPESDCTVRINFEAIPQYIVTWNVNGEVYQTTQVTEGSKPTFPATPSSCDATSNTFYGWATATWDGKIDNINGKTIYTSANGMPAVNGAVTYYAVFATEIPGEGGGGGTTSQSITTYQDGIYYLIDSFTDANGTTTYHSPTGTASGKLSSVNLTSLVTIDNDILTLTLTSDLLTDNMKYSITKNDGSYKIYNNSTQAYVEPKSSGTNLGTTETTAWSIEQKNNRFMFYYLTRAFLYQDSYNSSGIKTYGRQFGNYAKSVAGTITNQSGKECYGSGYFFLVPVTSSSTTTYTDYITSCTTSTTITLYPNGGIGDEEEITTEDESYQLPPCPFTREGYTFAGWATSEDGAVVYEDEATINGLDGTAVNLYAIWTANKYSITYKDQGNVAFSGTHEDDYPTQHTYGIETTLKGATKIGYTFEGWHTDATCTNKVTTLGATEYTGAITLYAKWIVNTHTLTWNVNGGDALTGTYTSGTVEYGATITPPDFPTRNGYDFTYWYDGTNMVEHNNLLKTMPDHDLTYTAQWEAVVYDISYQGLEGASNNANNPDTYTIESETITFLPPGERTGYKFTGWTPASIANGSTGNKTVTANWTAKSLVNYRTTCLPIYEVTLNPDGGTISDVEWVYNSSIGYYTKKVIEGYDVSLPVATKAGYTNTGWKTDPTTNVVTNPYTVTNNITLIAAYDCALATVGISGTYALTVGDVFQLKATAYDSNGNELECPANATYSWERYNSVDGVWEAITDDNSDGDNAKLTFNNCQIANCGTYRCHITYGDCGAWSQGYNVHCFHLKGNFEDDWNKEYAFNHTDEEGIATLSMDLLTGQTFEFKIYDGITQYGNGGTIETSVTGWTYGTDNQSNTTFKTGADGTYIFKLDFKRLINSENILVLDVTYPPANQAEGHTIYYDNLVHKWENVYYRIGHNRNNGDGTWGWNQNQKMTLVPGTSHLYKTTTPTFDNFEAWHIANNVSWADKNSIYLVNPDGTEYDITHATEYKKFVVVEDITLTPDEDGTFVNGENCTYYPAAKQAGMKKHKATVIPATGGTITVSYTDHDGTAKSNFTSGDRDLAHTCLLTITAVSDAGYTLTSLTVNDEPFTSGDVHTLTEDAVIEVTWQEKATPTFAWSEDACTATLEADNTFPTLNNPNSLSPVTYTSSNTDVATIDANGNITLLSAGTTDITATGAEIATHKSATDTYTLTVLDANCVWMEVGNDVSKIVSGSEVVITAEIGGNLFAIPNDGGNTAPTPVQVTINDILSGIAANNLIWDVEKDGSNNLIFHPTTNTSDNLFCNAADDGVRIGSTQQNAQKNHEFKINGNYLQNVSTSRYLGIGTTSSTTVWKCYSSNAGVIANQSLKIFQRICLDSEHYWVTWDAAGGQFADGSGVQMKDFAVGASITHPTTNPTREGHTFTGWSPSTNTMPDQNITFTAQWTQIHTITWLVGGAPVHTEEVANTQAITETPDGDPAGGAIGDCANTFVGWSEINLGSAVGQPAPADLCTAEEMKAKHTSVTGDKTFYAVFATNSGGSADEFKRVTSLDELSNGTSIVIASLKSSKFMTYSTSFGSSTWSESNGKITATDNMIFTLEANGNFWNIKKGTDIVSYEGKAYESPYCKPLLMNDNLDDWTLVANTGSYENAFTFYDEDGTYDYAIEYYSNESNWYAYSNKNPTSDDYYALALYIPDVSYSNYVTSCCGLVPVTNVVVSDVTDNSAVLTWTAPNTTTGITELEIRNAETETDDVLVGGIDVTATSATISGLDNCTTYSVYVVSVGECDAKSQIVSFTTLLSDPKTVTFVYGNGEENSTATTNCESSSITLPTPSWTGYRFLGWYDASSDKIGDGGASYTPDNDITLYAHWEELERFTVTYSVGSGDTAPAAVEALDGSSITVPALESNLYCVSFVGWTDAATYNHGTSALYEAGDSYTVTDNVTLKAVYAEGTGYVLVENVANLAANDKVIIVSAEADSDGKYWALNTTQNTNNRGQTEVEIVDNTIEPGDEVQILTLEAGTVDGTFAFNTGSGYLCAASSSSNHLKTQTTKDANGSWKIEIEDRVATIIAQGSYTRNWLRYNSSSSIFACYASGQKDVSIYKENIADYTTDPECVMYNVTLCTPTNGTISVDKTIVDPYGSTTLTFAPASDYYMLDAVTITPNNVAELGTLAYTSGQTSGGTVMIRNIQSDIEVCATFVEIPYHTITFVDMNNGNTEQEVPQTVFGGDITTPTSASAGCDNTWTFVGWAPSNSINGTTDIPAGFVVAGETISGANITGDMTYYSIYTNSSDGTPPFSVGKSGTYYFKAITESDATVYATGALNSSHRYPTNNETKIPFKLTYNSTSGKYTIKNTISDKYLSPENGYDNDLVEQDASYEWSVIEPTLYGNAGTNAYAKTGEYLFIYTNSAGNTRGIYYNGSYFQITGKSYSNYALYLEPASEMHYYNASSCTELVTMTFFNPFGESKAQLIYEDGYPEGYYKDTEKKTISTFPTIEYEGWTFIGWTAGTPYNDMIGDENLDDENASASAPTQDVYRTGGGLTYNLQTNITMYPVFTKFADNEPFDHVNGGDYYIYYIADDDISTSVDEYGAAHRIYASVYGSYAYNSTQSCANATLFTFTKLANGKWTIYDNTNGKYLCGVNSENNLSLNETSLTNGEWTIEVYDGNQVNAVCIDDYTLSARTNEGTGATDGDFKNYATSNFNNNSTYYHRVYLGTCTERVFSSNPSNKPAITMNGEPVVTSTSEQSIRSVKTITISATKLAAEGEIILNSDNSDVYFATDIAANFTKTSKPVTPLTITADEDGKVAMTTVYVHYKPTSSSALGTQTVTITATTGTEGQEDYATAETTAHVRNLPTDFVIAAKWGDNWYAMPADMDSQSSTEGWLIEVDDAANPTKALAAPNTTKYGLKSVYTSYGADDRFEANGEKLVFVENVEEETPVANQTLYNGGGSGTSNTNIQVYAQYTGYYGTNPDRYEWTPTTTDLVDYTLTSGAILSGDSKARTVSLDAHGEFGTLLQDKSYNGMVRLLPVDNFYETVELQVVEWKADGVSVMYTGAGTKYTTKVGNNAESSVQALPAIDHAVYSLSTSDLTAATNQALIITFKDDADQTVGAIKLRIPAIVASNTTSTALVTSDGLAQSTDIVVLDGATLTADATKYTYNDVVVYPGGNLVVGADGKLGVYTLTLRTGSSWGAAEYENKYPQFLLRGEYSNSSGQINLDYVTTVDYYYPLSVPEQVTITDIKYPVDIYGSNVDKANTGSFKLKYYDGAQRVEQGSQYGTGWVVVDESKTTKLAPNQGYAFWGIPKEVSVNDAASERQRYGIHRIPIKKAASDLKSNEEKTEEIIVTAHGKDNASVPVNDVGWNYLGNPYLAGLGSPVDTYNRLQMGMLVPEMVDGKWTGGWINNGAQVRYITVTKNCQNFDPIRVADATIMPFTTFFVQAAETGVIELTPPTAVTAPASIVARRYAAQQEATEEITTGILLTGNDQTDRTGLLIADNFTEEYDFNADLSKFTNQGINLYTIGKDGNLAFMAINQALAEQPIPLGYGAPADGEYTFAFDDERYEANDISALYLFDYDRNETTNLLHTDYSFTTAAGTYNERFALQVAFIPENATNIELTEDATIQMAIEGNNLWLNNLPTDATITIYDAVGHTITHTSATQNEMQFTLPTGYYLIRIANKQEAVVIDTVIP